MSVDEKITISLDTYEKLIRRDKWLDCLERAGVDNWEGWDHAVDLKHEDYPELSEG